MTFYEGTIDLGYLLFVVGPTLWETPLEFLLHVQSGGVSAETMHKQIGCLCQRWEEAVMRDELSDWTDAIRTSPPLEQHLIQRDCEEIEKCLRSTPYSESSRYQYLRQ